ncbi:hypothetical protein [Piscinibacter sp. XHJ-5]|uniref:hypothetical protein n=1 Tax=Piscinibacter sp. XHJ-5 TaxID=3037797 RepID=UPI0024529412|nr:hypothetical protein [Piscinibacter sp. XHJ-5]
MKPLAPTLLVLMLITPFAQAKLPPLSPDAQAKADEAKAKAAWSDKVAAFQLCRSMDKVAESYRQSAKAAGKETKPATPTPPCAEPGAFVAAAPAGSKPIEASGAHSPPSTAATPPSVSPATQTQLQGAKK